MFLHFDKPYSLAEVYLAYRKAKADAYYESTHFHAVAFATYERALDENLRVLLKRLNAPKAAWAEDSRWLGGYAYAPKGIESHSPSAQNGIFYRCVDPLEEWKRNWSPKAGQRSEAEFRLIITPSVNFQVVCALWILKVGKKYDAVLNPKVSYGNRLRRRHRDNITANDRIVSPDVNYDCTGLFAPYFSGYRQWRANGMRAIRNSLENDERIFAVTMDLQRFYHRVSPEFLLRKSFLARVEVDLSVEEQEFTRAIIDAINTWYRSTPDYMHRRKGALPVGLSASKIIANVLLAELDEKMLKNVEPIYYGRYVDDIFLVIRSTSEIDSGNDMMRWLAKRLAPLLSLNRDKESGSDNLIVRLKYARDADLVFAGAKQKVFNLAGRHGLDLVGHIEEQIRQQSSEHRLLAELPHTSEAMAARTLLAQSDASLAADALRKADSVSVRRLGLALLLRDVETYARDLRPREWSKVRAEFYGLVHRHLVTPIGFFNFFAYLHRVLGLMIACGDFREAVEFISRLQEVVYLLRETSTAGTLRKKEFSECRKFYAIAFRQVVLQATTVHRFRWSAQLLQVLEAVGQINADIPMPRTLGEAKSVSAELLYADMGRRPYREFWLSGRSRKRTNPSVPSSLAVRRILRLGAIREFRRNAGLRVPYWPAIAFPTRPITLSELALHAPALLTQPPHLRAALFAFRGARARRDDGLALTGGGNSPGNRELVVQSEPKSVYRVAIPSFLTSSAHWNAAVTGKPSLTLKRYETLRHLVNIMLREKPAIDYIAFPECSIPPQWAAGIALKLAERGISFIAGLEYSLTSEGVRNDAYVSLTTDWPWYRTNVVFVQPKCMPAHEERRVLYKAGHKRLFRPKGSDAVPPIYLHGGIAFSLLLCSDLTDIQHRNRFRGRIDALFVLEWNKDIETFSSLVESTANDLHVYAIQCNNRTYGDSRVRVPKKESYGRDMVRIKGGLHDYFVVAALDVSALRHFQKHSPRASGGPFKPVPIGYQMSKLRRM